MLLTFFSPKEKSVRNPPNVRLQICHLSLKRDKILMHLLDYVGGLYA